MNNSFLTNINKDKILINSTVILNPNLNLQNRVDNLIEKREKSIQLADNLFELLEYFTNNDVITLRLNTAYLTDMNIEIRIKLKIELIIPKVINKNFEKEFIVKDRINYSEMARFICKMKEVLSLLLLMLDKIPKLQYIII